MNVDELRDRIAAIVEDHEASPGADYPGTADRILAAVGELFTDEQISCAQVAAMEANSDQRYVMASELGWLADTVAALRRYAAPPDGVPQATEGSET